MVDFRQPDRRDEAMGMAGLVVHLDNAVQSIVNRGFNILHTAIEQVHGRAADGQSATSDDPGTPFADWGQRCPGADIYERRDRRTSS
jgi:hypothetical protein